MHEIYQTSFHDHKKIGNLADKSVFSLPLNGQGSIILCKDAPVIISSLFGVIIILKTPIFEMNEIIEKY